MSSWEYNLGAAGKALRESIYEGGEDMKSCIDTMEKLVTCYERIKSLVPEDDFCFHFDDAYSMAQGELDSMKEDAMDEYEALETVNNSLEEFYDLCDTHRIWVSV